jgi:hypothetical protein
MQSTLPATSDAKPGRASIDDMARNRPERSIPIDPLPSTQEPYIHIIAPNLDRISRDSFRRGTVEGRRAKRGLVVFAVVLVIVAVVAAVGILIVSLR